MDPHVEVLTTQQTPKALAQLPIGRPPLLVHSDEVKQVPIGIEVSPVAHGKLSNWTTENIENRSKAVGLSKY